MPQKNVRIRDALKTEYADFVDFCASLDKEFVSELTTSDYIAFRTQHRVNRDYVSSIRQALETFNPDDNVQEDGAQIGLPSNTLTLETSKETSISKEISIETTSEAKGFGEVLNTSGLEDLKTIEEKASLEMNGKINATADKQVQHRKTTESEKVCAPEKAWFNSMEELDSLDVKLPLYDVFGIQHNPIFANKDVIELGLSVRAHNCLKNNHCITYDAVLSKNLYDIGKFSKLGEKSLLEIIDKCKELAANTPEITEEKSAEICALNMPNNKKILLDIAKSIVHESDYDESDLNDAAKRYISLLKEAYQILGQDICLMALEDADKTERLCYMLNDYIKRQNRRNRIAQMVYKVSCQGIALNLHVLPFVEAIIKRTGFDLKTVFTEKDCFMDISKVIERYLKSKPEDSTSLMVSLELFINEIVSGITNNLKKAYEYAVTTDRVPKVISLRQEGHTLAEVGDVLGITRERVRQIEEKAISHFSSSLKHSGKRTIVYIHALLDGDLMIHRDEIAYIITDKNQLDLLWACIKSGSFDCKEYRYEKQYNAVVFKHENIGSAAKIINALPSYIFKDELEDIIRHAIGEGVWEEKIRTDINHRYKLYGTLYSEHRPTVTFVCDWILKNRFVNGYKTNDEIDAKRFREYIRDIFGEEHSHMTSRALDAAVSDVGVLCDRGKYIHPSTVNIDENLLQEIDQYIADSPKNAITYIELFEAFKDKLAGTQISNHYFLQGVMKQYRNISTKQRDYYVRRDYVTKNDGISPTDELDAFVQERGTVHKSEIYAEFPALNEISLGQVVSRCSNVFNIGDGNYIHASQFHIKETDFAPIKKYLSEVTCELPVNIRKVFDDCSAMFPEFMDRNELYNRGMLFAALNYMFRDSFRFAKPYIAHSDDVELTNRGVILSLIDTYDEIEIDELMDMLDERGIHYVSLSHLLDLIAPDYIRSDENILIKRSTTGIDEDVEAEALNILSEAIEANGFLPSCKVQDFIWYPSIDVTWTPYLLESLVISSDRIDYVPYSYTRSHRSLVVYVSKKYANCDFQSLLLNIIDEEYEKGTFTKKSDMREWLIEMGLMDVKLPTFLESTQYYYMSDDGRLIRRKKAEQ